MRRLLKLLPILLALLVLAGGLWWWLARPAQQQAGRDQPGRGARDQAIPVLVAAAHKRDVPVYLDGLGTVQASATVTIRPQVDGTLTEVRFREGQEVHAGDVLARIDPRTYQAALDQALAKKAQDQANLANARVDLTRYTKLAATAYTSAQQADTQKALVAQLEAQVAGDQAQIDNARTQLSYTNVTSPIDGRAGIRQVDPGNLVHASDATGIVVITTLRPINVVFTLPQQSLPAVAAAQAEGTPEVLALPQGGGDPNTDGTGEGAARAIDIGHLAVLDNQVDPTTGTIKLKAEFPNRDQKLWPGAFVTVRLKVNTLRDAVTVPPVAVQRGPLGPYVYVVDDALTASRRPVTVGYESPRATVLASGVREGERVVVDGAARLTDKAKVSIAQPPGAAPAEDAAPGKNRKSAPETASRRAGDGAS